MTAQLKQNFCKHSTQIFEDTLSGRGVQEQGCLSSDYIYSDFTIQAEAQSVLDRFTGDPHRLDRDQDSVACSSELRQFQLPG